MTESERALQQLVAALPQYEHQIRYWESQLEAISNVRADIFQAQDTLNGMLDSKDGMEMLVPLDLEGLAKHKNQAIKKNNGLVLFTIFFLFRIIRG